MRCRRPHPLTATQRAPGSRGARERGTMSPCPRRGPCPLLPSPRGEGLGMRGFRSMRRTNDDKHLSSRRRSGHHHAAVDRAARELGGAGPRPARWRRGRPVGHGAGRRRRGDDGRLDRPRRRDRLPDGERRHPGRGRRSPRHSASERPRLRHPQPRRAAAERLELDPPGAGGARRLLRAAARVRRRGGPAGAAGDAAGAGRRRVGGEPGRGEPAGDRAGWAPGDGGQPRGRHRSRGLRAAHRRRGRASRSPRSSATPCTRPRSVPRIG